MDKDYIYSLIKRFLRSFIAGGIASLIPILTTTPIENIMENPQILLYSLLVAFITGGIMAIDKLVRYTPINEER